MRTVVISGSRADKGPLKPVADALEAEWFFCDTPPSLTGFDSAMSLGHVVTMTAVHLNLAKPDWVVLLGDRYEVLGAAIAAYLCGIPIAHLSGGDITEGSQDDAMRHAITKLAHLHFPTNDASASRIVAMGEEQWRVHPVGCPGVDLILQTKLMGREDTLKALGLWREQHHSAYYNLVAYQPATLVEDPIKEVDELLTALRRSVLHCIFASINTDAFGRAIQSRIIRFCLSGRGTILEMDHATYLSAMKHCLVFIGNSSSGFYEAPTLKKAFVNMGDRQKGREAPASVISCKAEAGAIQAAMAQARKLDCSDVVNPYGLGRSALAIRDILIGVHSQVKQIDVLTKKHIGDPWPLTQYGIEYTVSETGGPTQKKNLSDTFCLDTAKKIEFQ